MLLEEATSKEQVEQALVAGDQELADDIDYELERAKKQWESNPDYCEYEEIDYENYIESDAFADEVIEQSPADYNLHQIPREYVKAELDHLAIRLSERTRRAFAWGPFSTDDRGNNAFAYTITPQLDCWFPENLLPENAEYIPTPIIEKFWKSFTGIEWAETSTLENHGWSEGDSDVYINAKEDAFYEWCRDLLASYFDQELRKDPAAGLARFFAALQPAEAAFLQQANLDQEELLILASSFLGGIGDDADDTRERIAEYVQALQAPDTRVREIIGTWTQTDSVAMGIIRGTLFEEAPWQLVKLLPFDLRLEGTMMSHCVGDTGMGYISAIKSGQIEIWSLRSRAGKPRFTLEVDGSFYLDTHKGRAISDIYRQDPHVLRAFAIKQLKGKGNRLPGFTDRSQTSFKFPEEVVFWHHVFTSMGVNPYGVNDLKPGLQKMGSGAPGRALQANPSLSFDKPYTSRTLPRDPYRYW
jgi:hypothetical protein